MEGSFFGSSTGFNSWPFIILIYIYDPPLILERHSFPVVFADDTSVVIKVTNSTNFFKNSIEIFSKLNKWLSANLLSLNYDKTNFLQFRTINSLSLDVIFEYNKSIDTKLDTKFIGITVDSTLQWKAHIDSLLIKLNAACYALRTLKSIVSQQVLVVVYFAYFHSIMSYGIIFWGSSPHCINIFRLQKTSKC
jgi:hypothetical protein